MYVHTLASQGLDENLHVVKDVYLKTTWVDDEQKWKEKKEGKKGKEEKSVSGWVAVTGSGFSVCELH